MHLVTCPLREFRVFVMLGGRIRLSVTSPFRNEPDLWAFITACSGLVIIFNSEDERKMCIML